MAEAVSRESRQRDAFVFELNWIERELAESRLSLREASPAHGGRRGRTLAGVPDLRGDDRRARETCAPSWPTTSCGSSGTRCRRAPSERLAELEREYHAIAAEEQEVVRTRQLPTGS